mmetsp:Transcript_68903/g.199525  ORF Transcript_68903/g.199525 Transcript_68903/m.199525 type:complete len:104 (-) Transcript_68903:334-645(-)
MAGEQLRNTGDEAGPRDGDGMPPHSRAPARCGTGARNEPGGGAEAAEQAPGEAPCPEELLAPRFVTTIDGLPALGACNSLSEPALGKQPTTLCNLQTPASRAL